MKDCVAWETSGLSICVVFRTWIGVVAVEMEREEKTQKKVTEMKLAEFGDYLLCMTELEVRSQISLRKC